MSAVRDGGRPRGHLLMQAIVDALAEVTAQADIRRDSSLVVMAHRAIVTVVKCAIVNALLKIHNGESEVVIFNRLYQDACADLGVSPV